MTLTAFIARRISVFSARAVSTKSVFYLSSLLHLRSLQHSTVSMSDNGVNCVLVDLSGTIHIDDTEIPGSVQALERCEHF